MTLRVKQSLFALLVADLIKQAAKLGYEVTLGEAYRSPQEAARLAQVGTGIAASLHTSRLAIDLNLFKDGVFLSQSEDHHRLGEWWEGRHSACRWGGRFKRVDGNHYELNPEGW